MLSYLLFCFYWFFFFFFFFFSSSFPLIVLFFILHENSKECSRVGAQVSKLIRSVGVQLFTICL